MAVSSKKLEALRLMRLDVLRRGKRSGMTYTAFVHHPYEEKMRYLLLIQRTSYGYGPWIMRSQGSEGKRCMTIR